MAKVIDLQAEKVKRLQRQLNAGMVNSPIMTGTELLSLRQERKAAMNRHPAGGRRG